MTDKKELKSTKPEPTGHFFIFEVDDTTLTHVNDIEGVTLAAAREGINKLPDGKYRILKDTSDIITKETFTEERTEINFTPRARKAGA